MSDKQEYGGLASAKLAKSIDHQFRKKDHISKP